MTDSVLLVDAADEVTTRYVLVHGAGGSAWEWHLVVDLLRAAGHEVVAVELPCDDETAGLTASRDVIADACRHDGDRTVVLVAQSFAGVTAPLACAIVPVDLLVLVCAMIPSPGERAADWWDAVYIGAAQATMAAQDGRELPDEDAQLIADDIPSHLREAAEAHRRTQVATPVFEPWPLDVWPNVATAVISGSRDRFFPPAMQRRVTMDRLGLEPIEIDAGHVPALSNPERLVEALEQLRGSHS